jgi:hypothetical protein
MDITQEFLLAASVLMEIPIAMVLLSRILNYRTNRVANIVAGSVMTIVQIVTLLDSATNYYIFFSIMEITTTLFILVIALKWKASESL